MNIFNDSSYPSADALACFTTQPRRIIIREGEQLFRLGTIAKSERESSRIFSSPWWIPHATYRAITKTAYRTGQSMIDVARAGLAVAPAWNAKMDWLMIFELQKPVYAWVGPAKPQPIFGDPSLMYRGNLEQAYVPGLAQEEAITSEAGRLAYCG